SAAPVDSLDVSFSVDNTADAVDVDSVLDALNTLRSSYNSNHNTNLAPFTINKVLVDATLEMAQTMSNNGQITSTIPPTISQKIFKLAPNITAINGLGGKYGSPVDNIESQPSINLVLPNFSAIGFSQVDTYWSFFLGGHYSDVSDSKVVNPDDIGDVLIPS
ncbi:hypothetical protein LPJ74_006544, partial [Coemansia sp. RSA 1843]